MGGTISIEEMKQGLKKLDGVPQDMYNSGSIDYGEFLAAAISKKHYQEESAVWAAFKVFDTNNDNMLSLDELREVLNAEGVDIGGKTAEEIMAEVDKDGSGQIEFHEFMDMMQ